MIEGCAELARVKAKLEVAEARIERLRHAAAALKRIRTIASSAWAYEHPGAVRALSELQAGDLR